MHVPERGVVVVGDLITQPVVEWPWSASSGPLMSGWSSDVVLPGGMTGVELAREVQRRRPNVKVLLTSGYGTDIIGRDSRVGEHIELLPKPFSRQALGESVAGMLASVRTFD